MQYPNPAPTSLYNNVTSLSDAKRDEIKKQVTHSIMGVFAVLYEGKLLKKVNVYNVLMLYGLDEPSEKDTWIHFDSVEFQTDYAAYKHQINSKPNESVTWH